MMEDWIAVVSEPIDAASAIASVTDTRGGAVAVFMGRTRAQSAASGRELVALNYEVFADMTLAQFRELARSARSQWPVLKLVLLHRAGHVPVGQCGIFIAVCAAHRDDAFAACRFLIDSVKARAAVWKKEIWSDGSETWVNPSQQGPAERQS